MSQTLTNLLNSLFNFFSYLIDDLFCFRYAIYQAMAYTGSCLASSISGYCLQYLGYHRLFLLVIFLFLLSFIFVIIIKQDGKQKKREGDIEILQKMKAVYKQRSNNVIIWLMLISCFLINVSASGNI